MMRGNTLARAALNQKGMGFLAAPILIKIPFEQSVISFVNVEAICARVLYTSDLLKIEAGWASNDNLNTRTAHIIWQQIAGIKFALVAFDSFDHKGDLV